MKLFENIIWWEQVWEFWKEQAKRLEKKETIFQIADFDYTLASRDEHFEVIPELLENRGDKWPKYLFENYGMSKYIDRFYTHEKLPEEILSKLDSSRDIIITAWGSRDFQIAKVRACRQLDDFNLIVTETAEDKILETIRYVLFELRYIPSEIIVYEDRPQFFIEYKEFMESILNCQITIMFVEMNRNLGYNKIEQV